MKLRITVDQKTYEVDVEVAEDDRAPAGTPHAYIPAAPTALPSMPPPPRAAAPESNVVEDKVCRSPVAGIVVRVNAQMGQQIQANDPLLVLEAMKMETNITSPVAGKVKAINASVGDGVQVGQVLVEFE
ncbi:MAG: acetyl-CoA carboxylase biotin carboxyl carrier protein subunit [Bryobacteraceae bacterium]|jgi:methylmalonyl-CoA carboxyltransferase small subunit